MVRKSRNLIKIIVAIIAIITITVNVNAQVLIEEVMYDPINSENNGEAVMIKNYYSESIDISGWVLATKSSLSDAIVAPNTILTPGETYLIADKDFSLNKVKSSWPDPNHEEPITLSNDEGWIKLINHDIEEDILSWGYDFGFGNPATIVKEGYSLLRVQNTNDNSKDFIESIPQFFSTKNLTIDIFLNATEDILRYSFDKDEDDKVGFQLKPKNNANITFHVNSSKNNIQVYYNKQFYDLRKVNNTHSITFNLTKLNKAGKYYIELIEENIIVDFEYLPLKQIYVEQKKFYELPLESETTKYIQVKNLGNIPLNISAKILNNNANLKLNNIKLTNKFEKIAELKLNESTYFEIKIKPHKQGIDSAKIELSY